MAGHANSACHPTLPARKRTVYQNHHLVPGRTKMMPRIRPRIKVPIMNITVDSIAAASFLMFWHVLLAARFAQVFSQVNSSSTQYMIDNWKLDLEPAPRLFATAPTKHDQAQDLLISCTSYTMNTAGSKLFDARIYFAQRLAEFILFLYSLSFREVNIAHVPNILYGIDRLARRFPSPASEFVNRLAFRDA